MQMHQTMMGFRRDKDAVRGKHLERALLRRVLRYPPYRAALIGFFVTVMLAAAIGVIPALLFRALIDDAVGSRTETLVLVLRARGRRRRPRQRRPQPGPALVRLPVGEGLIYDMRVSLFDHVQRLPISFFTRTQTGSLIRAG